jgi:hypothetical protein
VSCDMAIVGRTRVFPQGRTRLNIGVRDGPIAYNGPKAASKYGLWPRNGAIRVGSDADVALVDPTAEWTLTNEQGSSKAGGWSPYAGRRFKGRVVRTVLPGQTIAENKRANDDRTGASLPGSGAVGSVRK